MAANAPFLTSNRFPSIESNSSNALSTLYPSCFFLLLSHPQKSIKPEKEGEEKVKKPRFHNILNPPRRLSRVDSTSGQECVKVIRTCWGD